MLEPRAIVTDIEGTTSSLSFVKDALFPYSREKLPDFVRSRADEPRIRAVIEEARDVLADRSAPLDAVILKLLEWLDSDQKLTPLKTLQGYIWEQGFTRGELEGHVYEDAVQALRAWNARGIQLYVYSSGSVASQKLVFEHTAFGDLRSLFAGYFDTTLGGKLEKSSYSAIANAIDRPPSDLLFLSDNLKELDAARDAGVKTLWLNRYGSPQNRAGHGEVTSFAAIDLRRV